MGSVRLINQSTHFYGINSDGEKLRPKFDEFSIGVRKKACEVFIFTARMHFLTESDDRTQPKKELKKSNELTENKSL